MIEINENAPNFTLANQNDKNVSLNDFSGKWLVLYFYPKDNTSGCTKEACDFTDSIQDFENMNATVLGVSPDSIASHRKFIEKFNLKIDLLADVEKTVMKAYGAWGMKKNYGKEYEGVIRSTVIISPDSKIVAKWNAVKVRVKRKAGEVKHSDIVREKLADLQK